MLLRSGFLSFILLLASRLFGLVRESAQAAAFGSSGFADVAVLMLTLPDWTASLLAGGALAYVLLPQWAAQPPLQQIESQRRVAWALLAVGSLCSLLLAALHTQAASWLAPGISLQLQGSVADALYWSAAAMPAALLASLWVTRLQHERDFVGLYAANLVVNGLLIVGLLGMAGGWARVTTDGVGVWLLMAMLLRLAWLRWRITRATGALSRHHVAVATPLPGSGTAAGINVWLWATLSAGLPLTLPFVARSLASRGGEGALATFSYAWKLVELPLVLVIQLIATLAFPAIARALAQEPDGQKAHPGAGDHTGGRFSARQVVGNAFSLSWAMGCATAAGLTIGAPVIAQLLFGWGRMSGDALVRVAAWSAVGAWSLPSQALIAVGLTVLAARRRMRMVVFAYGAGLVSMVLAGSCGASDGKTLMLLLGLVWLCVAAVVIAAMGPELRSWIRWQALFPPFGMLCLLALSRDLVLGPFTSHASGTILVAAVAAALVMASAWVANPEWKTLLRR